MQSLCYMFFFFYTFIVYSKMERETREFHMENAL